MKTRLAGTVVLLPSLLLMAASFSLSSPRPRVVAFPLADAAAVASTWAEEEPTHERIRSAARLSSMVRVEEEESKMGCLAVVSADGRIDAVSLLEKVDGKAVLWDICASPSHPSAGGALARAMRLVAPWHEVVVGYTLHPRWRMEMLLPLVSDEEG